MRLWIAGLAIGLSAGLPARQERTLGFAVAPDVAVRIHNLVGATRVEAWDRDSIHVAATVPPGAGRLYGGGGGAVAKLGVEGPNPGGTVGATLVVRVPRAARVWIKSASAEVRVESVRGEIEVSSVTGDVTVRGDPRVATLETIDGDVDVAGAATVLRVRTGAGRVTLVGPRADLSATTVQGPIRLESGGVLSARLSTVSGAVEVRGGPSAKGRLEIETHDGDVHVTLPDPAASRLDAVSISGKVVTRLGGGERIHGDGVARFTPGAASGGPVGAVTVRSFSGGIRIDSNPER